MKYALLILLVPMLFAQHPLVSPGNYPCYYRAAPDDTQQPYYLYVPPSYDPREPTPVAMTMHGFGGRAKALGGGRKKWADQNGWLIVSLDGRSRQNWDHVGEDDIYDVFADLARHTPYHPRLNVDSRRLYLEGCSMGGHGAYRAAFRYPDRVAAVAPGAGWTTYQEFYAHWYDASTSTTMPHYVDPTRKPLLETASSLWQVANGGPVWMSIFYDDNDWINPAMNAELVIDRLRETGHERFESTMGSRGHCGSFNDGAAYRFFDGKTTDPHPPHVHYRTNTLRYNRAFWVRIDRLALQNRWSSIDADTTAAGIVVKTDGLLGFTLDLAHRPGPTALRIDGGEMITVPAASLSFSAVLDAQYRRTGWELRTPHADSTLRKSPTLSGTFAEALRGPFTVIYGTQNGTLAANAANPDWVAAQHFAVEWNAYMILHWGRQKPPADRKDDWWAPPYPFKPGGMVPPNQATVAPIADTALTLGSIPADRNLIIFGDVNSNWITNQLAPELPVTLTADGVDIGARAHKGAHVRYLITVPNPLAPERYAVFAKGYLSSRVDANALSVKDVGKDLEGLPFFWPDYVVWDARKTLNDTVQPPLKYLPDAYLEAGYFGEDWTLDLSPPAPNATFDGDRVHLSAIDAPGGFGVSRIEYQLDGADWQAYAHPFPLNTKSEQLLSVRATDKNGRFIYRGVRGAQRGFPAPGNTSKPRTFRIPAQ
jgi:pimeloyl-ACP methyl ester carboxylesterase